MKESDVSFLLSLFYHSGGVIEGRKRLQKIVCVMKHKEGVPFSFEFKPYFYGPYSEELSDVIETLVGAKLLVEERELIWPRIVRYKYSLSDRGKELSDRIVRLLENSKAEERIEETSGKLNALPIADLVYLAKKLPLSD